jgi:uncharacterized iron-regulated membrane protein
MEPGFRHSMNELHTWAGVVLGAVLFAVFWMGTLSVFDKEIDRWMAPMTRLAVSPQPLPFDALRPSYETAAQARSPSWSVVLPSKRQPIVVVSYRESAKRVEQLIDPGTGTTLPNPGTWAGTRFIYPFHYMLHLPFLNFGYCMVGLGGLAMLVLCVSGINALRKIWADFFTFRPQKKARRALLDLHNVVGVLGFPFHIVITLSGLIIMYALYFPQAWQAVYPDRATYLTDTFGSFSRPKLDKPGHLASMDQMVEQARLIWDGGAPDFLSIRHPGDAAAYVTINRSSETEVTQVLDTVWFDAATGAVLHQRTQSRPVMAAQRFIFGMHLIQFQNWTLRWIYFVLGLSGCALIATGYLFWLESRRKKHMQLGLSGVRLVEGLAVGSTTGIIIATLTFFVTNRLLSPGAVFLGQERAALEVWAFYVAWSMGFGHAWLRTRHAWCEQCGALAVLTITAVALNWITTGDHILRSLMSPHLWPIAGMDLLLLMTGLVAGLSARKLYRKDNLFNYPGSVRSAEAHLAE